MEVDCTEPRCIFSSSPLTISKVFLSLDVDYSLYCFDSDSACSGHSFPSAFALSSSSLHPGASRAFAVYDGVFHSSRSMGKWRNCTFLARSSCGAEISRQVCAGFTPHKNPR